MYAVNVERFATIFLGSAMLAAAAGCSPQPVEAPAPESQGRAWFLSEEGAGLYEAKTLRKLAHVALPRWVWAHEPYACPPVLALGPRGEAIVTSNVMPVLWRVDPRTLVVTRHELTLDADTDKDVGFTSLSWSAGERAYFGVSAAYGTLWRIDPLLTRAEKVRLPAPLSTGTCAGPRE